MPANICLYIYCIPLLNNQSAFTDESCVDQIGERNEIQ
jgi:hypothetical protein